MILAGLVVLAVARSGVERGPDRSAGASGLDGAVTFTEDVAPILFEHCAPCHRPGGSAPFALLTYRDAKKRARQIATVTGTGFMPPWLPAAGYGEFAGQRRLSDEQIAAIEHWAATGAMRGDPAALPPAPQWPDGWRLGDPDLVLELPRPYELPAEGVDVYRNFAIPVPVPDARYVRAVEFRFSNLAVVHHARMLIDRTPSSRLLDSQDSEPGFEGMIPGNAHNPDGVLVGWTPGKSPWPGTDGIAWKLEQGTDVVVQLHMIPSGRPEVVQPALGLYFADEPPTLHAYSFVLGSREIDIPAGSKDHLVEDSYALPIDVDALGIYPHAHYLGKDLQAFATLPDGTRRWLLWIQDWDFNWQDEYRYASPVPLPRGTTIIMRYRYDNSADNARNPNSPPRRVVYGARTSDEMAELMLMLLPRNDDDLALLEKDSERHRALKAIAYRKKLLESNPGDAESHAALASSYLIVGRTEEAISHLEASLALRPGDARVLHNLGYALRLQGRVDEAVRRYRQALRIAPDTVETQRNLARALRATGRIDEALQHFRDVLRLQPDAPQALNDVAWILATHPDRANRDPAEAVRLAEQARELSDAGEPLIFATLAAAYAAQQRFDRAVTAAERALELAAAAGPPGLAEEIRRQLELYRSGEPYRAQAR